MTNRTARKTAKKAPKKTPKSRAAKIDAALQEAFDETVLRIVSRPTPCEDCLLVQSMVSAGNDPALTRHMHIDCVHMLSVGAEKWKSFLERVTADIEAGKTVTSAPVTSFVDHDPNYG